MLNTEIKERAEERRLEGIAQTFGMNTVQLQDRIARMDPNTTSPEDIEILAVVNSDYDDDSDGYDSDSYGIETGEYDFAFK